MNSYYSLINNDYFEIEEILSNQSDSIKQRHFEFLMLMVKLFDNLIDFEEFEICYENLFENLKKNEIDILDKILKLEIKNIIEFKDKNNLWIKEKNLTLKRKGNDINE